jgi:hypothetical protein
MAPEDAPATKRDVRGLEERLSGIDERLNGIDERIIGLEERLLERMRDMQTELLKAFLPYQEQAQLRIRPWKHARPPWKRASTRSKSA